LRIVARELSEMNCRSTILSWLIAGLLFVPAAGQAAEPAQALGASGNDSIPRIGTQPSEGSAEYTISSDDWQRSGTKQSAELRFTKPKIPGSRESAPEATTGAVKHARVSQPADLEQESACSAAPNCVVEARGEPVEKPSFQETPAPIRATVTIISDEANDRERAYAAAMRLKQFIEQPQAVEAAGVEEQPEIEAITVTYQEQPAETRAPVEAAPSVIRSPIEQLWLVARRLGQSTQPSVPRETRDWRLRREQSADGVTW
jgi:hypothetical protein